MRFPVSSLKTAILAQLVFLIVAAMLLIHVVEVKFAERDLIQARARTGRMLVGALEHDLGRLLAGAADGLRRAVLEPRFRAGVTRLLGEGGFSSLTLVDLTGSPIFFVSPSAGMEEEGVRFAREALETGTESSRLTGTAWGVIWLSPKDLVLSSPISTGGGRIGGLSIRASLNPIYEGLRRSQKLILLYLLLDTLVLTIVGVVLLSRIVVKPIRRLLRMAGDYKGGDQIPIPAEASGDEIGELSRSLHGMLKRLEENKRDLRSHIASLEKTNQELQQVQGDLIRSEKLASVGRLAAGIAHEIGNPIGITLGYLELLRKGDVTEEERKDFLGRIEHEVARINRIIRQLLDFSRPSGGKPETTHVHDLMLRTVNILKPQPMMQHVEVRYTIEAARDAVLADPGRLQQVFLNIIMNAADALEGKGTGQPGDPERLLWIRTGNSGDVVEIEFADNGPGIGQEELGRIFDPFYTTKEPGKGTGLGLSVSYRIVEDMGGAIRAESAVGKGTTIRITLPLQHEPGAAGVASQK
ncbi:MAG: ATP-binding protein [Thermodesulfobacteriota bacterium]